ncbi:GNAT family N-acetyltransferase [Vibrio sp. Of7-15]|uniref:GNAT family N-acetyltransferase n=1 Tax=Vibrio sp. Of7-15 TaxID=2724879 RepID=UPI001EF2FF24|nr:GNAT family N-acetyltransferase [Vibrio sp. Of7-15]MCG7497435.1 GNAT family N-acetyltransferase [Vibrio sp. Of7-15]
MEKYIRKMKKEDLHDISQLYRYQYEYHRKNVPDNTPVHYKDITEEDFNNAEQDQNTLVLVLCILEHGKEAIAGSALINIIHQEDNNITASFPYIYIDQFVIGEQYQNNQLGSYFLEYIKEMSSEHGYKEILLDCWVENKKGIEFYSKNDFTPIRQLFSHKL